MPSPPPELMEELVLEILLRIPADDPATLVRAALVCKSWRRLVSDPRFSRRFHELHRAPPLLGFLCNKYGSQRSRGGLYVSRFVPTSSFLVRLDLAAGCNRDWHALEARHGRVLLRFETMMRITGPVASDLVVWDPVTDERWELPDTHQVWVSWNAAVLCAHTAGAACEHLDCRGGPFVVISLGTDGGAMYLCVYSSEDGSWSEPARVTSSVVADHVVDMEPTALAGNTLYFQIDHGRRILGYDLDTRETSVVDLPPLQEHEDSVIVLMTMEDGGQLGFAILDEDAMLSLWSMEASRRSNGAMRGWTKFRVIDLEELLTVDARSTCADFVAFAHGVGVFVVGTPEGLFSFHLTSGQVRKVLEAQHKGYYRICSIVPYTSFCTPDLLLHQDWERSLQVTDQE